MRRNFRKRRRPIRLRKLGIAGVEKSEPVNVAPSFAESWNGSTNTASAIGVASFELEL
jgi:hypothetical protein